MLNTSDRVYSASRHGTPWRVALGLGVSAWMACGCGNSNAPIEPAPVTPKVSKSADAATSPAADAPASVAGSCLVGGSTTTDFPAVVRLGRLVQTASGPALASCSGTFISPTAVLTAAHCVDGTPNGGVYLIPAQYENSMDFDPTAVGTAATQVFTLGVYGEEIDVNDPSQGPRDIAIALFPPGMAAATMPLGPHGATGDQVTLVGFGETSLDGQPDDFNTAKRTGTNKIVPSPEPSPEPGVTVIGGEKAAQLGVGGLAMAAKGDSGGPAIVQGAIVGILSKVNETVDADPTYYSYYIDVSAPDAQTLIQNANQGGADIPAGTPPAGTAPTAPSASSLGTAACSGG